MGNYPLTIHFSAGENKELDAVFSGMEIAEEDKRKKP
jgi:hypothetical protein